MVTEYKIVKGTASQLDYIEMHVNQLLKEGWTLNGALHTAQVESATVFVQSLYKVTN